MISWFDLFAAFFVLASMLWSFFRGFTREVFSIAAIVGGVVVAVHCYDNLSPLLAPQIKERTPREIAAFAIIFVMTAIAIALTGVLVRRILHLSHALNMADRFAGMCMGLVKGVLILMIIVYPLALAPDLLGELAPGSRAAPLLIGMGRAMMDKVAPDLAAGVEKAAKEAAGAEDSAVEVERYMKDIQKLEKKLGEGAASIKGKLGMDKERKNGDGNNITEKDREELEKLIEKLDEK